MELIFWYSHLLWSSSISRVFRFYSLYKCLVVYLMICCIQILLFKLQEVFGSAFELYSSIIVVNSFFPNFCHFMCLFQTAFVKFQFLPFLRLSSNFTIPNILIMRTLPTHPQHLHVIRHLVTSFYINIFHFLSL